MRITVLVPATIAIVLAASQATQSSAQVVPSAETAAGVNPAASLPVEKGEGRAVALKLADDLVSSFVYREQAKAYAAMLRTNAAKGRYDNGTRSDLAKLLTDDLQAVHKDGHLHVMLTPPEGERQQGGGGSFKNGVSLIQSAKTVAPGIGYIRFTAFAGRDEEMAAVRKWLADNRDAKTLIFDLRNHHGGGLNEQDAIFSYVYDAKTPLVKMAISKDIYDRRGSPLEGSSTMVFAAEGDQVVGTHFAIPGEATALRTAKIYLLTSNRSASAAEHFALALKSTGRATLIGEATAGANHFGGAQPINEHFAVWMPIGRTYDIQTGKDWEGDGVAPDIAVDPKLALVTALEKAGLSHQEAVRLDALEVPAEPVHSDQLKAR